MQFGLRVNFPSSHNNNIFNQIGNNNEKGSLECDEKLFELLSEHKEMIQQRLIECSSNPSSFFVELRELLVFYFSFLLFCSFFILFFFSFVLFYLHYYYYFFFYYLFIYYHYYYLFIFISF
jgi:hypothetical protein